MDNETIVKNFLLIIEYVETQIETSNGEILEGLITLEDLEDLKNVVNCVVREH